MLGLPRIKEDYILKTGYNTLQALLLYYMKKSKSLLLETGSYLEGI